MSRSPLEPVGPDAREDYEERWDATARIVRRGGSWSGRELHCTFLNTGGERFADVSAPSGLSTAADGRAVAAVDWDLDGDLDLWLGNRSAPRLVFQRNESPAGDRWLELRLRGTDANTDAIGARVELFVDGGERPAGVKTVHAGDGFLTQSSRWVHFGLGDARRVDRVAVRWPSGEREVFEGLSRGARFVLAQGAGAPRPWRAPERELAVSPGASEVPAPSDRAVVRPSRRLPMPEFEGRAFADGALDGPAVSIRDHRGAPLLVNLWASWCAPCVGELKEMTRRADELRAAGIEVLALSVDGLGADESTPEKAAAFVERTGLPFAAAPASAELLAKLELLHGSLYMDLRPFPLPTSFLVDADGRLTTIYRGPVEVDRVLADARREPGDAEARRAASVPFTGRWIAPPPRERLLSLSERYLAEGWHADAAECYRRLIEQGLEGPELARVHHNLATILAEDGGAPAEVHAHLDRALALAPDFAAAWALRGELLQANGDVDGARAALSRAIALEPEHGRARYALGKLCAEAGDLEGATEHLAVAARLAPGEAQVQNDLGVVLARRGLVEEAAERFAAAVAADPEDVQAHLNLAMSHAERGDAAALRAELERVVELDPDRLDAREWLADELSKAGEPRAAAGHYAHVARTAPGRVYAANRLAWILATTRDDALRDGAAALQVARRLEEATGGEDPGVLDTLAAALAETGDFEAAEATARRALALAGAADAADVEALRARIERYAAGRPYRE